MRLQKIFLFLLILFAFFQSGFGQENPEPRKVDEFGKISCEGLIARFDALLSDLMNNPTSLGYIVIYGKKGELFQNLAQEEFLLGQALSRNFDRSRFVIIRGREGKELHGEFWIVPAGAEKPLFEEGNWNLTLPPSTKPFVFSDGYEGQVCPIQPHRLELFSEILESNPNSHGHLVIYAKSLKEFRNGERNLLKELIGNYKVSRNRLKFFFVKKNTDYSHVEVWFVPQKKK